MVGQLISDFAYSCVHSESGNYEIDWITDSFYHLTGFSEKELNLNRCWLFTVHHEDEKIAHKQLANLKIGSKNVADFRIVSSTGEVRWLRNHVECVEDKELGKLRIYGAAEDITKLKKAIEKLEQSEEKFRALIYNSADLIRILDENGLIIFDSPSSERILGYPEGSNIGQSPLEFIHPDDLERVKHDLEEVYENKNPGIPTEFRIRKANGEYLPVESLSQNMIDVPSINGIVVTTHPIKERKEMEDKIRSSLEEKEVLLKEIHHRVKNNMQIISSLLNLQANYVEGNDLALDVLMESQNRVKSMAMIHEKLYQSNELTHIGFEDYIQRLVSDLFYSYNIHKGQIKPIIEVEDIQLNIETAVPCGLIISELVSNSLKHAFPEGKKGKIKVSLKESGDKYELIICDDGVGVLEELDFKNTKTLGLQLVNNLVNQIGGVITLDRDNETFFKIIFKELEYKERI
jgi:PAS domain S-box-containing protein